MRTYLSAIGWVDEKPEGNRLRWHLPAGTPTASGRIVGFPSKILVERAPARADFLEFGRHGLSLASIPYPVSMWSSPQDIDAPPFPELLRIDMSPGVQGITFVFAGPIAAPAELRNGAGVRIKKATLNPGEHVYWEVPDGVELKVMGFGARLEQFRTLDAFKGPGVDWEVIAEITFDEGLDSSFADVAPRFSPGTSLTTARWAELQALVVDARSWVPAPPPLPRETSPFEGFALMTGLRWEYAVVAGLGFCDGPGHGRSELDGLRDILREPAPYDLLYRVVPVSSDKAYQPSNIVPVRCGLAPPLAAPPPPVFVSADVRLRAEKPALVPATIAAAAGFARLQRSFDYSVRAELEWSVSDARAIGVEIEEEHDASAVTGAPASHVRYACRTLSDSDTLASAIQPREFEVPFPDVRIRAVARAFDGWDRWSPVSGMGPWRGLDLKHSPFGPAIQSGDYREGNVELRLEPWSPDSIVRATGGVVEILRQTASPRTVQVNVNTVAPVVGMPGLFEAQFAPLLTSPSDFAGGTFSTGLVALPIQSITGTDFRFQLPDADGGSSVGPGLITLKQSPHHAPLWSVVKNVPVPNVSVTLSFSDALPITTTSTALTYATRVRYWGPRRGPIAGLGQAMVHRVPVVVPPPFDVSILSLDFFGRALVRLHLNAPAGGSKFRVFIADGLYDASDPAFAQSAEPGLYEAREPLGGTELFDMLNLPILSNQPAEVTIAVQRIGNDGGMSDFSAVQYSFGALG